MNALASTPHQFLQLALWRLSEATALYTSREYRGCFYISGYVVECGLKAVACLDHGRRLPDALRLHDLARLTAVVRHRLRAEHAALLVALPTWNHNVRYSCASISANAAAAFLNQAKEVLSWLSTYL